MSSQNEKEVMLVVDRNHGELKTRFLGRFLISAMDKFAVNKARLYLYPGRGIKTKVKLTRKGFYMGSRKPGVMRATVPEEFIPSDSIDDITVDATHPDVILCSFIIVQGQRELVAFRMKTRDEAKYVEFSFQGMRELGRRHYKPRFKPRHGHDGGLLRRYEVTSKNRTPDSGYRSLPVPYSTSDPNWTMVSKDPGYKSLSQYETDNALSGDRPLRLRRIGVREVSPPGHSASTQLRTKRLIHDHAMKPRSRSADSAKHTTTTFGDHLQHRSRSTDSIQPSTSSNPDRSKSGSVDKSNKKSTKERHSKDHRRRGKHHDHTSHARKVNSDGRPHGDVDSSQILPKFYKGDKWMYNLSQMKPSGLMYAPGRSAAVWTRDNSTTNLPTSSIPPEMLW